MLGAYSSHRWESPSLIGHASHVVLFPWHVTYTTFKVLLSFVIAFFDFVKDVFVPLLITLPGIICYKSSLEVKLFITKDLLPEQP